MFSIGGGNIRFEGETSEEEKEVYPQKNFTEILETCKAEKISLSRFITEMEDDGLAQIYTGYQNPV